MIGKLLDESTALRIKESAKVTFMEKGYDGATMQAIADGAKVNKALVHYYYRSKDRLFLQIIKEELMRFQGTMSVLFKEPGRPLQQRLVDWIDAEAALWKDAPRLHLFLISELTRHPALIEEVASPSSFHDVVTKLAAELPEAEQQGASQSLEALLCMVYSLLFLPALAAPLGKYLIGVDGERWNHIVEQQVEFAKNLVRQSFP